MDKEYLKKLINENLQYLDSKKETNLNQDSFEEYLNANNSLHSVLIQDCIKDDELKRMSASEIYWSNDKKSHMQILRKVKKGEVYQIEFGKNYIPEMSYEHRGLVLGNNGKLAFVLPIFSYNPTKHLDVYHPIDSPKSKSNYYLLKKNEVSFIEKDSVIKLNDLRTISLRRIKYKQPGRLLPDSEKFKEIELLVITKYFNEFVFTYNQMKMNNAIYVKKIAELEKVIEKLKCKK